MNLEQLQSLPKGSVVMAEGKTKSGGDKVSVFLKFQTDKWRHALSSPIDGKTVNTAELLHLVSGAAGYYSPLSVGYNCDPGMSLTLVRMPK